MLFSEEWDLEDLNEKANQILEELIAEGWAQYISLPNAPTKLPATINIETAESIVIVCSGYPEMAGAWAYSLLEKSSTHPELLETTSMAPYFRKIPDNVGLVVLNPHEEELKSPPDASIPIYLSQLVQLYQYFSQRENTRLILLGFSLGGDVILRFLQNYPTYADKTYKLIFIDPTPPSIGRRKLAPKVLELVDQALFFGLCDQEGRPGEFAEFTKMRLKIQPDLIPCESHGQMPNLIWPQLQKELQKISD